MPAMPSTPDEMRELQAKRFAYLQRVYDDWQDVGAGSMQKLHATVVQNHLGLGEDEAGRIMEFLKGRGLLDYTAFGPLLQITDYGIDYVERALAAPDQPTQYFPAINVLHIEQVIDSQIQQGTTQSQQTGEWKGPSGAELAAIAAEIRSALATARLNDAQRDDADANLETLEVQAKARRPNKTITREALASLQRIAEQVGATLIAAKLALMVAAGAAG